MCASCQVYQNHCIFEYKCVFSILFSFHEASTDDKKELTWEEMTDPENVEKMVEEFHNDPKTKILLELLKTDKKTWISSNKNQSTK